VCSNCSTKLIQVNPIFNFFFQDKITPLLLTLCKNSRLNIQEVIQVDKTSFNSLTFIPILYIGLLQHQKLLIKII
jgi:hypothetical protein